MLQGLVNKLSKLRFRSKSFPVKSSEPPSEEFKMSLIHSGSSVVDCEHCGRTHFAQEGYEDPKELDDLLKKSRKEPNRYIMHDGDGVSWGNLDGKQYVADCPCNSATRYEEFIEDNKYLIADYLQRKSRGELELAKLEFKLAERTMRKVYEPLSSRN